MDDEKTLSVLEEIHRTFNRRSRAMSDPVSLLYRYDEQADREVAGLVAASLAYGTLKQIMRSVADALGRLDPHPAEFIRQAPPQFLRQTAEGFVHRVANADRFWRLLWAIKDVLEKHGSIQACFLSYDDPDVPTVLPGLQGMAGEMLRRGFGPAHLLADPCKRSACKRWHLYLRWMVRSDDVDPGGWSRVSPSRLLVPLDTHTWRLWSGMGFTDRRTCGLGAVLEITEALRRLRPEDPVRYDFALMHASASDDPLLDQLLRPGGD